MTARELYQVLEEGEAKAAVRALLEAFEPVSPVEWCRLCRWWSWDKAHVPWTEIDLKDVFQEHENFGTSCMKAFFPGFLASVIDDLRGKKDSKRAEDLDGLLGLEGSSLRFEFSPEIRQTEPVWEEKHFAAILQAVRYLQSRCPWYEYEAGIAEMRQERLYAAESATLNYIEDVVRRYEAMEDYDGYDVRRLATRVAYSGVTNDAELFVALESFSRGRLRDAMWLVKELALPRAIPALEELRNSDRPGVRDLAKIALGACRTHSPMGRLMERLRLAKSADEERRVAVEIARTIDPTAAGRVGLKVGSKVFDEEARVKMAAYFAANFCEGADYLPKEYEEAIEAMGKAETFSPPSVRQALLESLAAMADGDSKARLLDRVRTNPSQAQSQGITEREEKA